MIGILDFVAGADVVQAQALPCGARLNLELTLHAGGGDAFDEGSLRDEEEDDDRENDEHAGGHELIPGRGAVLGLEGLEAEGEGVLIGILQKDEGAEEIAPGPEEGEEGDDGERRAGEGEDDSPVDHELVAAVDAGGFGELVGDGDEELAEEEYAEG